jgi:hypothetical protein
MSSTSIKTSWSELASAKGRWVGAESIGLTLLGKLDCPSKKHFEWNNYDTTPGIARKHNTSLNKLEHE